MKRFYKKVEVGPSEEGRFSVLLDARPIKTPAKFPLELPTERLARAIADEWEAQIDTVDPATMPLMRYAATALDRVSAHREAVISEIAAYGKSDLLCHRADSPVELVAQQDGTWQPLLEWAAEAYRAKLTVTAGIMPVDQSRKSLKALRAAVAKLNDMTLSGLHGITSITGSVILGLAVVENHMEAVAAWDASQIDERFQADQWGEDEEAATRRANHKAAVLDAARFLALISD
jgi:chaperone required for assembly of F1-ATPase